VVFVFFLIVCLYLVPIMWNHIWRLGGVDMDIIYYIAIYKTCIKC
jgi:hypothetical protein